MTMIDHIEEAKIKSGLLKLIAELSELKHRMMGSGRLPHAEYQRCSARRAWLAKEIARLQVIMVEVKAHRRAEADKQHHAYQAQREARPDLQVLIGRIIALRDVYRTAAGDGTRTPAYRYIAKEVSEALDKALKL
jgi:hypothetical protein